LGLSVAQGQCSLPVRVLSVPVSSFCQCTGTVRVLSVPVSSFCQCTGTVGVLSVPVSAPHSFMHHRHCIVLPIESAIKQ